MTAEEFEHCSLSVCAAEDGHAGTCDEASGWNDQDEPHRVRLSRQKGWRKPPNTVVVSRPSKWGNPYVVGRTLLTLTGDSEANFIGAFDRIQRIESVTPRIAVELYRLLWLTNWNIADLGVSRPGPGDLVELRGKNLACWCPLDQPCHADVLLELANPAVADRG